MMFPAPEVSPGPAHDMAAPYGMLVTVVPLPLWFSEPLNVAKVRSPMSTVSVAGSMRSLVNIVRTFVPGDSHRAVRFLADRLATWRSPARTVEFERGEPP